jgi:hypothetical protein
VVSQLVTYLEMAGGVTAISAVLYYLARAIALVVTVSVGLTTRDDKRRAASVAMVNALCRGWPRSPRLPGSGGG